MRPSPPEAPRRLPLDKKPYKAAPAGKARRLRWMRRSKPLTVALLPPLAQAYSRRIPPIPARELLAAAEDGLLWQQLFPEQHLAQRLLAWGRVPDGWAATPDSRAGDSLRAAFGDLPDSAPLLCTLRALSVGGRTALRFVVPVAQTDPERDDFWRQPAAAWLSCHGGVRLFNPWRKSRLALLLALNMTLASAALALAATGHWLEASADGAPAPQLKQQLAQLQQTKSLLQAQAQSAEADLHSLQQARAMLLRQNLWLNSLASALPRGMQIERLLMDGDSLTLSAHAAVPQAFDRLAKAWTAADSAGLELQSMRRQGDERYLFSARVRHAAAAASTEGEQP